MHEHKSARLTPLGVYYVYRELEKRPAWYALYRVCRYWIKARVYDLTH